MLDLTLSSLSFLFLTSVSLLSLIYFFLFNPNSKTPCPQSFPLIGNVIGFVRNRNRFHDWVTEMLSTTPSLTLQVNGLLNLSHGICTANPANVDHLLRLNFNNYVKGTRFQSVLHELLGHGIFNADGDTWIFQRKVASHEFNTKSLKHFIAKTVCAQLVRCLIPVLSAACDSGEIVDLQDLLRKFAFSNICHVAFGFEPDSLKLDQAKLSFVDAFDFAVENSSTRFMTPLPVIWKMKRFFDVGSEKSYRDAIEVIDDFAYEIIRLKERELESTEGEAGEELKEDLLSRFMGLILDAGLGGEEERRKFLRDIVISFVLAGKEASSTALTWFFWLISGHPQCKNLIYKELSFVTDSEALSKNLNYDELKSFHYLHAALSESMRLFPPVPINSRLSLGNDVLADGTLVGRAWFADYSAYAMGRMERVWGPDCREYKPERWLNSDGVYQAPDQFKFPVFHAGPRICLGKEMAYVQMKSIAAALMSKFEVEAIDGGATVERMMEPPYTLSLLLRMKDGLKVRLRRRTEYRREV